ncbi:MAG: Gfo/Idh/MocA family oxidoreductase [Deltaproteobacteria bacterium]|nr:Gfo/Idh/MocA family oxidoreductase [Deltaproteobacteria bacterium]
MKTVRVGIIGAGWISITHLEAFRTLPGVEIVAQWSPTPDKGLAFCKANGIPDRHDNLDEMLARDDIDVVTVSTANHVHAELALKAMDAGKHVIIEKPLCLKLEDADALIAKGKEKGLVIGYAEELCYAPKYVRAKELADSGGLGDIFLVKQSEKHAGPYSPWFFQPETAGGGILMDMGCHAIEYCRWTLGKPAVKSVYCDLDVFVHGEITQMDDHCMMIIEFEGGKRALVESSWTLKGGMESKAEIHGTQGVVYANLLQEGDGMRAFSEKGSPVRGGEQMMEAGWTTPQVNWLWSNGYPQEMADFIRCIREGGTPTESAEDGKVVLEIMIAGYISAAEGRKVEFPLQDPGGYDTPVDIWINSKK